jgi:hypothetical protein
VATRVPPLALTCEPARFKTEEVAPAIVTPSSFQLTVQEASLATATNEVVAVGSADIFLELLDGTADTIEH